MYNKRVKINLNPDYQKYNDFIEKVPSIFSTGTEILYQERNEIKLFEVEDEKLAVKSFKIPHVINKFAYSFIRSSKAKRSFEHALALIKKGIPTPIPIAYIEERKNGLLNHSYYISTYDNEYSHIRSLMYAETKDEELMNEFVKFIASLHDKGVYFLDLSPGNILWKRENGKILFSLIDINRMKFKSTLSTKERYKNFERLSFKNEVIKSLALEYAKIYNLNENECYLEIKEANARFFMAKYGRSIPQDIY